MQCAGFGFGFFLHIVSTGVRIADVSVRIADVSVLG